MKLLGTFEQGTIIQFFVISNGWRNGEITNGESTQYSDPSFNPNDNVQSLIFHYATYASTVVCVEDITVPNGDNDYNDTIFQITASPETAIDVTKFLQL